MTGDNVRWSVMRQGVGGCRRVLEEGAGKALYPKGVSSVDFYPLQAVESPTLEEEVE